MNRQRTIQRETECQGIGLQSGTRVHVRFCPAAVDAGITFVRTDLPGSPTLHVGQTPILDMVHKPHRTSLGSGLAEVQTVEHLLASLFGLGIDNLRVELDTVELPGMDGSALPFVQALKAAGIAELDAPKHLFTLREPVWVEEGGACLLALPAEELRITYTLSYDVPYLRSQHASFAVHDTVFEHQIAPARTFCLEGEVERLRQLGLGKGADYANTLVIGQQGVIKNTLRFDDECVRHKILDLLGDLYLLGGELQAHVIAVKSGHALNVRLVQKIREQVARPQDAGRRPLGPPAGPSLDINEIQRILPHRYPFLLVDRIVEFEPVKRAVGIKNVSTNEPFFQGHFPGHPVMPGVLVVEALAQVAAILILMQPEHRGKLAYFTGIDNVRFRHTVVPGDQLQLTLEVVKLKSKTGQAHGVATVNGKVAAEADLMFFLVDR